MTTLRIEAWARAPWHRVGVWPSAAAPPGERVYTSHNATDKLPAWSVQVAIEGP